MYYYILNVGLRDGEVTNFQYKKEFVELAVRHAFRHITEPSIRFTNTGAEPTAVITIGVQPQHREYIRRCTCALSELLNQDCIAVWDMATGTGKLLGHNYDRMKKWGEFDVQYFQI